jgi:hypothetical protein
VARQAFARLEKVQVPIVVMSIQWRRLDLFGQALPAAAGMASTDLPEDLGFVDICTPPHAF